MRLRLASPAWRECLLASISISASWARLVTPKTAQARHLGGPGSLPHGQSPSQGIRTAGGRDVTCRGFFGCLEAIILFVRLRVPQPPPPGQRPRRPKVTDGCCVPRNASAAGEQQLGLGAELSRLRGAKALAAVSSIYPYQQLVGSGCPQPII